MLLRPSRPLFLFRLRPVVNFKPGAGVVYHPTAEEAHLNEQLRLERAAEKGTTISVRKDCLYDNLNPDGVIQNGWMSFKLQRQPMRGDSNFGGFLTPYVDAFKEDELARFYNLKNLYEKVTFKDILVSLRSHTKYNSLICYAVLLPQIVFWSLFYLYNRIEPKEAGVDPQEYKKHLIWHLLGHRLDREAYKQYAEARRMRKWRDDTINPEDYIPPKYRFINDYRDLEDSS